jgi:hypothetical protein
VATIGRKYERRWCAYVRRGDLLYMRELVASSSQAERARVAKVLHAGSAPSGSTKKARAEAPPPESKLDLTNLTTKPNFGAKYQAWYSPALRVVEQLLPDRYDTFRGMYRLDRRKQMDVETYGISDYISGLKVTRGYPSEPAFDIRSVAMRKFEQQIAIVRTAEVRLDSILTDIGRTLQAALLDDEISTARTLLGSGHLRSAGVVAGVVLEAQLKRLLADHKVSLRKKALLSNLNDALKDATVYGFPQWRQIQYLADIRNLCAHKSDGDPTRDEVDGLINEVDKVVRTVF